jgi:hypothetical protein
VYNSRAGSRFLHQDKTRIWHQEKRRVKNQSICIVKAGKNRRNPNLSGFFIKNNPKKK